MQKHFDNIVDTMTGADGGFKFLMLHSTLLNMEDSMLNGNVKADTVLSVVRRFSLLIDAITTDANAQLGQPSPL